VAAARLNSRVPISQIQTVQSLDVPELALYRTLRRIEEHERAGVLVAANAKVIKRLLASRFTVVSERRADFSTHIKFPFKGTEIVENVRL
jgi:hypothetical protein